MFAKSRSIFAKTKNQIFAKIFAKMSVIIFTKFFEIQKMQCCGDGAGAARSRIIWSEPEP
jgi:hypothetical protein